MMNQRGGKGGGCSKCGGTRELRQKSQFSLKWGGGSRFFHSNKITKIEYKNVLNKPSGITSKNGYKSDHFLKSKQ